MPDDMLKDAIETARQKLDEVEDFESQGKPFLCLVFFFLTLAVS